MGNKAMMTKLPYAMAIPSGVAGTLVEAFLTVSVIVSSIVSLTFSFTTSAISNLENATDGMGLTMI